MTMKRILLLILCLAGLAFGLDHRYVRPQVNTVGVVAYFKLWAGLTSTGIVFDYALNGNQGTISNALPAYPGFSFDGTDDEINCGSDSSIDNIFRGGGTVSIWILSDGIGENSQGRAVDKNVWRIQHKTNSTTMELRQNFSVGWGEWTFAITAGVWQLIVVVYDYDLGTNNPTVYLNGVSVTATETVTPGSDSDTSDAASNFVIGDNNVSSASWNGKIGDVMLFNRELTAIEAKNIYEITRWRYGR